MVRPPEYQRTIFKRSLASPYLAHPRSLRIYVPPGYQEWLSYPVIYCQDGEQFFNFGRIATALTKGILEHGLDPAIIVGIDVEAIHRTAEYAPVGKQHQAYCHFFAEELVPWIQSQYAARPLPSERILAGDSLGATVSLHLALDYPNLFHKLISFSGAFFSETQDKCRSQSDLSWLTMYILVGLHEEDIVTDRGRFDFLLANRLTQQILEQQKAVLCYQEQTGTHTWGFWQQELPHALHYFLSPPQM